MGVNGLWTLLNPTSRAIKLESLSGKVLAVDSSIWLFQFVKAMRDSNGNSIEGCHIIGFLHRINSLLYNGIKPVFVFDGAAPTLKYHTNREREDKRVYAEQSLQKTAAKLLEATIKLRALEAASGLPIPCTPEKSIPKIVDDYELPLENNKPSLFDPRLATDSEIRDYIQTQNIAFDINAPEFYTLPNIVQHEIIANLKNQSRMPNFERVQNMINNSKSAFDFSKHQIVNLIERAELMQRYHDTLKDDTGVVHKRVVGSRRTTFTLENQPKSNAEKNEIIYKSAHESDKTFPSIIGSLPKSNQKTLESYLEDYSSESWINNWIATLPECFSMFYDPNIIFTENILKKSVKSLEELLIIINKRKKCLDEDGVQANDYYIQFIESAMKMKQLHPELSTDLEIEASEQNGINNFYESDDADRIDNKFFSFDSDSEGSVARSRDPQTSPKLSPVISSEKFLTMFSGPNSGLKEVIEISDSESDIEWNVIQSPLRAGVKPFDELKFQKGIQNPLYEYMDAMDNDIGAPKLGQNLILNESASDLDEKQTSDELLDDLEYDVNLQKNIQKNNFQGFEVGNNQETMYISIKEPEPILSVIANHIPVSPGIIDETNILGIPDQIKEPILSDAISITPVMAEDTTFLGQFKEPIIEANAIPTIPIIGENTNSLDQVKNISPQNIQNELKKAQSNYITVSERYKRDSRDASGVTNKMVDEVQELLQHFGIPYINAPMEAESQCAFLKAHDLVDGIITDDSDVFLFGGDVIYRNVFNQKQKFVEQFTMDRIGELGLNRNSLVQMAMLLGSDYTVGIKGFGPVSSIEVVNNWKSNGLEGLKNFKEWALNVKKGIVSDEDLINVKSLVGKCKKLVFPQSFPDQEVYNAYMHPIVDQSKDKFEWKTPDLEKLRWYLGKKLGWDSERIDKLVVPVVKEVCAEKQKQTTIESFFVELPKKNSSKRVLNATRGSRKRHKR